MAASVSEELTGAAFLLPVSPSVVDALRGFNLATWKPDPGGPDPTWQLGSLTLADLTLADLTLADLTLADLTLADPDPGGP